MVVVRRPVGHEPDAGQLEAHQAVAGGPDALGDVDGVARPELAGIERHADGSTTASKAQPASALHGGEGTNPGTARANMTL